MEDKRIIELFFERSEAAIAESEKKYGKYLRYIAFSILGNESDCDEIEMIHISARGIRYRPKNPARSRVTLPHSAEILPATDTRQKIPKSAASRSLRSMSLANVCRISHRPILRKDSPCEWLSRAFCARLTAETASFFFKDISTTAPSAI